MFGSNRKNDEAAERLFQSALVQAGQEVQYLLRKEDLYPIYISQSFQPMLGVDPVRLVDDLETLYRFIPDADRIPMQRAAQRWDGKSPLTLTSAYANPQQPDAAPKQLRWSMRPVLDDAYILVSIQDITSEAAAASRAQADLTQAQQTAQDRTDFLTHLGNQILAPLNGIKGVVALAQDHSTDADRLASDLALASDLSDYLLALVNDALDMSSLEAGTAHLEAEPFDMRFIAADLLDTFKEQALEKGVVFKLEMADYQNFFVVGDRARLAQAVSNLVANALKFTDAGGSVVVSFQEANPADAATTYVIRIHDTGLGMDQRFVDRVFKPFEQGDARIARQYGGAGLGLSVTQGLVKLMDGTLAVDTEPGRGSEFIMTIPLPLATQEQVDQLDAWGETLEASRQLEELDLDYSLEGKRFLLAEDNEVNAMIAIELLSAQGATVDHAIDGVAAVQVFAAAQPGTYDAVLMDIYMPNMDGWEAARQIRALDRSDSRMIPIIAVSANTNAEDARRSRQAGMDAHIGKPIDFDQLKAELAAAAPESALTGGNQ